MPNTSGKAFRDSWARPLRPSHGKSFVRSFIRSGGAPASYEKWKCMKFEARLRDDIQFQVRSSGIRKFYELVERCRRADDFCKKMTNFRISKRNAPSQSFDRNLASQGHNFKNNNQTFRNFNQAGGSQGRNFGGSFGILSFENFSNMNY
ncbi:hypothetical protein PIB30_035659 [Stylosanthes scabra]|uniref:Uncharacterized protein n=1 Tax=Stylosanthes scabra TaxID=79078 RepID=A0ABU6SD05_9FABA|nr:hypothetical protein [Stylosanthes scabra]